MRIRISKIEILYFTINFLAGAVFAQGDGNTKTHVHDVVEQSIAEGTAGKKWDAAKTALAVDETPQIPSAMAAPVKKCRLTPISYDPYFPISATCDARSNPQLGRQHR